MTGDQELSQPEIVQQVADEWKHRNDEPAKPARKRAAKSADKEPEPNKEGAEKA